LRENALVAIVAASLATLASGPARADDPCAAEIGRHCRNEAPVQVLSCLQAHRADLSPACQDHLELALVSVQSAIQDCEPDAFQFCKNVGRGEPTTSCLSQNQGKLSWRCQQDFDAFARIEARSAKACADEAARSCPGVKPGKGDVYLCLLFRGKNLSPACRAALAR
jgi:hypothetical protein